MTCPHIKNFLTKSENVSHPNEQSCASPIQEVASLVSAPRRKDAFAQNQGTSGITAVPHGTGMTTQFECYPEGWHQGQVDRSST